jgi:hypothetical protein
MKLKHNIIINDSSIDKSLKRLTNLIYKLLPEREENLDWESPLQTIIVELTGMNRLLIDQQDILFPLLCKLEGLFTLTEQEDFQLFRRTIFECLSLISNLREQICQGLKD